MKNKFGAMPVGIQEMKTKMTSQNEKCLIDDLSIGGWYAFGMHCGPRPHSRTFLVSCVCDITMANENCLGFVGLSLKNCW